MAKGTKTGGGSRKGKPNKATAALKDLILGALSDVGGRDYLARQAEENPNAFMSLIGRVLPLQVTGKSDVNVNHTGSVAHEHTAVSETAEWLRGLIGSDAPGASAKPLPN